MIRLHPRATRTDTLFPDTTLFRSAQPVLVLLELFQPVLRLLVNPRRCPQRVSPAVSALDAEHLRKVIAHPVLLEAGLAGCELQHDPTILGADLLVRPASLVLDVVRLLLANRSEGRRAGKECVRTCRSRWSTYH